MTEAEPSMDFVAYPVSDLGVGRLRIVPAMPQREWMNEHSGAHPYRCLPLTMANQNGWFLLNPTAFTARWSGGPGTSDVTVRYDRDDSDLAQSSEGQIASSWFGSGVITLQTGYIFRTPPGYNLLVRGPVNWPRPGIQALEGLVESDWMDATFTMNWKLTIPDMDVRFEAGEPFCMITPIKRGAVERMVPVVRELQEGTRLHESHRHWVLRRGLMRLADHRAKLRKMRLSTRLSTYEMDYMRGRSSDGKTVFDDHQTRLDLRPFIEDPETDA